jgi:hypothetical protein
VAAPNIIAILYHRSDFIHTIPALQALAPGLVFLYINSVLGAIIISTKNEKKIIIMAAAALVFNLTLNLILIPQLLHVGAAIVTSLTELLLTGISIAFVPKHLLPLRSLLVGIKALFASLVMAVAMLFLLTYNIIIIIVIAALIYFVTATLLRTIPREDLQALFSALRRKAQRTPTELELHEEGQLSPLADEILFMEEQSVEHKEEQLSPPTDEVPFHEKEHSVVSAGSVTQKYAYNGNGVLPRSMARTLVEEDSRCALATTFEEELLASLSTSATEEGPFSTMDETTEKRPSVNSVSFHQVSQSKSRNRNR